MARFKVYAVRREFLIGAEIEADNEDQAEEKYIEMWEQGNVESVNGEFESIVTSEIKDE